MGLGPPVCTPCKSTMHLHHRTWLCPYCGTDKATGSLWLLGQNEQAEFEKRSHDKKEGQK